MNKIQKSKSLFESGKNIVVQDRDDLDNFPSYIERGKGAYVWDYDGNQFLDFTCAKGAIILGYSYEEVDNAVIEQIQQKGNIFFTQYSELKFLLAQELCVLIPCAERAIFFKSGSDATSAAIRLARIYSEKSIVLTCGYHGWHDWALKIFPEFIIPEINDFIIDFGYNLATLNQLLEIHKNNIACIIITPEPNFFNRDHLLAIQSICIRENITLIFDEVKTGFRFQLGGYQKYSGIVPDMATFSKGMSNGYGISVLVGKNNIMENYKKTHLWGTYYGELIPIVAALKTIEIIKRENVMEHLWHIGKQFIQGLDELFIKYNVAVEIYKYPTVFHIIFDDVLLGKSFFKNCLKNGLLFYAFDNQMINFSHTEQHIGEALNKIDKVLKSLPKVAPAVHGHLSKPSLDKYTLGEFGGIL